MKTALVLSGGGMFGAWQAGAWRALAPRFHPDLIVGASVGSLNGYAIAGGASPEELCDFWRQPELARLANLPGTIRELTSRYPAPPNYSAVITDVVRLKPRLISGAAVTWRHLAASCALPLLVRPQRIDGRWYCDGGLLNPLPVWAAVELGATHIIALHVLPKIPLAPLQSLASVFRRVAGHHPPLPAGIELKMLVTPGALGSGRDILQWKRENAECWMEQGFAAAKNISVWNCIER